MQKLSFADPVDGFYSAVKERVGGYFSSRNISSHANAAMFLKTVTLFTVTFGAYGLILSNQFPLWAMWMLCVVMGMGTAGLGFSVAHDAIHGSYSANQKLNYWLGYTMNLIGGSRYVWSISHNIVHHTYTNIHHYDEDLEIAPFIRLSANEKPKPIHRFQHILAFFAYSFATLHWVFLKDFIKMGQKRIGAYENKQHPRKEIFILIFTKAIYYTYIIVIPLLLLPVTWWQFLIGLLTVHMTAGIILGVVFQLAHVVEATEHPREDEQGQMEFSWAIHQMHTTANFAMGSKFINWYVGGLNFQVEHHLFPRVCSIHYPAISKIVQQVATEYHVPYHYNKTFFGAVRSHYRTLRNFGRAA